MIALRCLLTWESIGKHPHRTRRHNEMFMSLSCPEDSKAIKIKIEGCHFCQETEGCHFVRKTSHFRGKNRVPKGRGWQEPRNPNFCSVEPVVRSFCCLEPWQYFTVDPGAFKTFAAEPLAPNIEIWTFLHTDSVITCFVVCWESERR